MPRLTTLQIGAESFETRGGGLNRYFGDLLNHLPAADVDYRALVAGNGSSSDPNVRIYASPTEPLRRRLVAERRTIVAETASHPFDLIAAHFAPYALPALRFCSRTRPLVIHFHGPWGLESKHEGGSRSAVAAKHMVERWVYRRAARCITLSSAFAELLAERYGVDRTKIDVVPGGIDCGRFDISQSRADCRASLGWPTDRPIVLCVRRLVRRMGLENLLIAAAEVRRRNPEVLFILGGTGPLRADLEVQSATLGLADHVRLIGYIPDAELPLAYRAADLSIVPSLALEGFGLIAAESLAAGTPALVAPVGGLPEVVNGLDYPLILTDTSPATIAAHLCELLNQSISLWQDACRDFARRYDWKVVAPRIVDVYRRAVEESSRR